MTTDIASTANDAGFVDDATAAADAAEPGRAFAGHGSLREHTDTRAAAAELENFCLIDETGAFLPDVVVSFAKLAEVMCVESGRPLEDQLFLIVRSLIDRRIAKRGFLGGVSLDLNPAIPGRPQDLGHPDTPAVLFYECSPGSKLYDAETCRAIAVWFTPEVDELGYAVAPRAGRNGRLYSDDTFVAGYVGVVDKYASLQLADEAMRELRKAVRVLATPQLADEPEGRAAGVNHRDMGDGVLVDDEGHTTRFRTPQREQSAC